MSGIKNGAGVHRDFSVLKSMFKANKWQLFGNLRRSNTAYITGEPFTFGNYKKFLRRRNYKLPSERLRLARQSDWNAKTKR